MEPFDAFALRAAIVLLPAATGLAAVAPTRRAVRTDPRVVLQDQ